ncbi:MAG: hypothetical protein JW741_16165 [Sedimentisphaerales bacterium]|nr:hypothetical protein [Sedimentisphaerales bacterium]
MPKQIIITAGPTTVRAELNDSPTARAIAAVLPIEARASRWGGEIYFTIDVEADLEDGAREVVEAGELAFWPPGRAFCVFFGSTPASSGSEIRAASPVNVVGRVTDDLAPLWDVADGTRVSVGLV